MAFGKKRVMTRSCILAAMLLPVLGMARKLAQSANGMDNLRQQFTGFTGRRGKTQGRCGSRILQHMELSSTTQCGSDPKLSGGRAHAS